MAHNEGLNMNWMGLANMFLGKLKTQSQESNKRQKQKIVETPVKKNRPKAIKTNTSIKPTPRLHPDQINTIAKFETLRMQLLRQLVLYQKQLLAMRMPTILPYNNYTRQNLEQVETKGQCFGRSGQKVNVPVNCNNMKLLKQPTCKYCRKKETNYELNNDKIFHPPEIDCSNRRHNLKHKRRRKKKTNKNVDTCGFATNPDQIDDNAKRLYQDCSDSMRLQRNFQKPQLSNKNNHYCPDCKTKFALPIPHVPSTV